MIGVRLQGRLGNQMFQYAFAFAISKKLNTRFFIDEDKYSSKNMYDFFELYKNGNSLVSKFQRNYFNKKKYNLNVIEVNHKNSCIANERLLVNNNCIYNGFFQSELYFHEYRDLVKKEFTIKKHHLINYQDLLNINNDKPTIVLHIRRTDYLNYGNEKLGGENLALPIQYYNLCLKKISNLDDYNIVFVTDDPSFVHTNFYHLNPIISSSKSPIVDFQIIMNGDIVVVANSSFSWWGAYLNEKAKKIFAPMYWSGFKIKKEYPADVIPSNWESIEF